MLIVEAVDEYHGTIGLTHPATITTMARESIKHKWGIKNPPPWLVCAVLKIPYSREVTERYGI